MICKHCIFQNTAEFAKVYKYHYTLITLYIIIYR